jgi:muramidase (phage lysozyme)/LAS superfamily LD-carboxypeptidase LdcB
MQLSRDFYVGIVEDNKDPNRKGRIKVRVQTLYHTIPIEDIPYAYPFTSLSGKEFQVPAIGKLVNVLFLSDDLYSPYYIYSENYNENLQRKLKSLSDEEYVDFTALLFDESTQIYVKGKTFTLDQLLNKITIDNASINLELKDNEEILNLGSRGADQDAVLGTRYFEWMDKFIAEFMKPFSMIGNIGAPIIKTKLTKLCQEYQSLRPDFVSNNVKIVDNGEVKILSRSPETINNKNDIDLIIPIEDDPILNQQLNNAILDQNQKACETLKNAAPSDIVPIRPNETKEEPNKVKTVRQKGNQSYIDGLHPQMRPYATRLIERIEAELDTKITVTSGYRSIEAQRQIISQGNKDAAQPGKSYHQYGLAIDIWPTYKNKLITKATQNNYPDWNNLGSIGKSLGFRWGQSFGEKWHFDMGFGFPTSELYKRYNNQDFVEGQFVNLGDPKVTPTDNQFNGQDYNVKTDTNTQFSVNEPCESTNQFNKGSETEPTTPINKQSDESEGPVSENSTLNCKEKNAKKLLDQISEGEGTTNKKASQEKGDAVTAYDITFGYGKYTPTRLLSGKNVQPLSNLTIGEIKEVQLLMLKNGSSSTAVGKYQFIRGTLNELVGALGLPDSTIFSADTQDKLAMQKLILNRGYDKWLNGKMSDHDFQKGLSKEWASIANPDTGKSYYHQHVGTSDDQIKSIMNSIKKSECS